jgi:hypothetical protein
MISNRILLIIPSVLFAFVILITILNNYRIFQHKRNIQSTIRNINVQHDEHVVSNVSEFENISARNRSNNKQTRRKINEMENEQKSNLTNLHKTYSEILLKINNMENVDEKIKNRMTKFYEDIIDEQSTYQSEVIENVRTTFEDINLKIDNYQKKTDTDLYSLLQSNVVLQDNQGDFEIIEQRNNDILEERIVNNENDVNDIRTHFSITDVSEENSINIYNIENEIGQLNNKMQNLQNDLNEINYV